MDAPAPLLTSLQIPDDLPVAELACVVRGMERLVSVVGLLSTARDLDSVIAIVRRGAREITGADGATFVLREGEQCFYADEDAIAPLWKGRRFPIEQCISGWSMLNAETVVLEDVYLDDRIPAVAYRPTFVKSLVMVPIGRSAPLGAIGTYWASSRRAKAYEVKLLQALADATASAFENVQRSLELARRSSERERELEIVSRELESLSYSVSHDLRAPLRAILGFNQALLDEHASRLDADAVDCLQRVNTSAHRLGHLIDDLLELSRVTRAVLSRGPVNLSALAEDVVAELRNSDASRNVCVTIAPELHADGDARLLRRALAALIGNAWKFTTGHPAAEIHFDQERHAGGVRFAVRDNGVGFDEKYSSKLFVPFQRLHAAHEFPGSGIGLALVQRIISRHGGRVSGASKLGEGATFAFTLP